MKYQTLKKSHNSQKSVNNRTQIKRLQVLKWYNGEYKSDPHLYYCLDGMGDSRLKTAIWEFKVYKISSKYN